MAQPTYTDQDYLSMIDFVEDYGFDFSEATWRDLADLTLRALAAGWEK